MRRKTGALGIAITLAILLLNCSSVAGQPQSAAPTIDHPPNITYTVGTTGHNITWHPFSESPNYYEIDMINPTPPTLFHPGLPGGPPVPLVPKANWTGNPITQNVDGWQVGTYYCTCTVYDTQGRNANSTVEVTVEAFTGRNISQPITLILSIAGMVGIVAMIEIQAAIKKTKH